MSSTPCSLATSDATWRELERSLTSRHCLRNPHGGCGGFTCIANSGAATLPEPLLGLCCSKRMGELLTSLCTREMMAPPDFGRRLGSCQSQGRCGLTRRGWLSFQLRRYSTVPDVDAGRDTPRSDCRYRVILSSPC